MHTGSFSFPALKIHLMLFPIIELQPLSYIRHTYMISITAVFIIQLIYKLLRQAAAVAKEA